MSPAEVREVQLSTLAQFTDWCTGRGLRYQLAFGSLLGAVRHEGFIPWDDDIDVAMPRRDYEQFCSEFMTDPAGNLQLGSPSTSRSWPLPFAKIWDSRTLVVEHSHLPIRAGVGLDVFPIDDVPGATFHKTVYLFLSAFARLLEAMASIKPREGRSRAKAVLLRALGPVARLFGYGRVARLRNRVAIVGRGDGSLASVPVGPYVWTVSQAAIASTGICSFESLAVAAPHDADAVLTAIYGDYMTPVPDGQRVTHHMATKFWRPT